MRNLDFNQLTDGFNSMITNSEVTEGKLFNYHKLFQHAVHYYLLDDRQKLIPRAFRQPLSSIAMRFRLRSMLRPSISPKLRPLLVLDDRRTIDTPDGPMAYYFHKVLKSLSDEEYSVITDSPNPSAFHLTLEHADWPKLGNRSLDALEKKVLKDIHQVLQRAKKTFRNEVGFLPFLESVFLVFFETFHRSYHLMKGQGIERFMLTCHYHHEGQIAAARLLGIEVIEFQHGLIARQDLYYVYPKAVASFADRALFPDRLYVFGSYWRALVLEGGEFRPEQVHVLGDYSLQSIGRQRYLHSAKENAILIGAQKNMPETYVAYTESLLRTLEAKHPNWKVWVKLHPLEKVPEAYARLEKHPQCEVFGKGSELMPLLCKAKIQISVYSTTFYDALGLGVLNFSLQGLGSEDYARAMVREGVAFALEASDDPIDRANDCAISDLLKVTEVYPPFNPTELPWSVRT